ncbi:MAG: DUF4340 domain-containing protein [Pseudomonadota bacterium]
MNARTLLNLILAGVALLLVLVIFYQPGLEQPSLAPPITTVPAESISSIRVTRKERTPLTFTKSATGWQLENKQGLPASEFQLHALLGILGIRSERSYPSSALDLTSAGLEPPQATLLLGDTLIHIGNTEPLEHKRYVRHEDTVYLVTDTYQHLINADWTNFVDRSLLPENAGLTTLQLPGLSLTLDNNQQWQVSPENPDANDMAIKALVAQWQAANALYLRRYEGAAASGSITLKYADNRETVTLHIIEQEGELVLARPDWGIQYHFSANMRDTLLGLPTPAAETGPDAQVQGEQPRSSP